MIFEVSTILRNAIIGLCFANGAHMALSPRAAGKTYGFKAPIQKGTASYVFFEGNGFIALGHAVTVYLSTVRGSSLEEALGFGLLFRLFWLIKSILLGSFSEAGINDGKIKILTTVASSCAYSLLSGKGDAALAAAVISSVVVVAGALLFLFPISAVSLVFGASIGKPGQETATKGVMQAFGKTNVINAAFMIALTRGADPRTAFSSCCLVWALAELYDVMVGHYADLGMEKSSGIVNFLVATVAAFGTLS